MELHVLNDTPDGLAICIKAAADWQLDVQSVTDSPQLPANEADPAETILIADGAYAHSHIEDIKRLSRQGFFRVAAVCPDASSAVDLEGEAEAVN